MSVKIGKDVSLSFLNKIDIEGGKAPELDCRQFELWNSTNINITAIKCKLLKITGCKSVVISSSVIDEIEVKDSEQIYFAGSTIKKQPKIIDSDVDYSMCIINIKDEIINKEKVQKALNKCFGHTLIYKGIIQIFPNATYNIDGKKVVELYEELGIKNEIKNFKYRI